jgi:peptidoglycan-N-acetylglucosamine deacetylase
VNTIMRTTSSGSIILEHDGGGNRSETVAALKIVIPRLLDAGYHFVTP